MHPAPRATDHKKITPTSPAWNTPGGRLSLPAPTHKTSVCSAAQPGHFDPGALRAPAELCRQAAAARSASAVTPAGGARAHPSICSTLMASPTTGSARWSSSKTSRPDTGAPSAPEAPSSRRPPPAPQRPARPPPRRRRPRQPGQRPPQARPPHRLHSQGRRLHRLRSRGLRLRRRRRWRPRPARPRRRRPRRRPRPRPPGRPPPCTRPARRAPARARPPRAAAAARAARAWAPASRPALTLCARGAG